MDEVIDQPTNLSIINSSGWSPIEPVTHANRYRLIQCLITEEVIMKREKNMNAFFKGLNSLKVGDLLVENPEYLFVFKEHVLTADTFLNLIESLKPPLQKEASFSRSMFVTLKVHNTRLHSIVEYLYPYPITNN